MMKTNKLEIIKQLNNGRIHPMMEP